MRWATTLSAFEILWAGACADHSPPFYVTEETEKERELCGFDPPKDYCGFCDGRYRRSPGGECKDCSLECPGKRCSSDPNDYCDRGMCCKDFNCNLFFGCEFECSQPGIGCNGVCCERRDEVSQDFWEKAQEKAARWFIKRGAKFLMGGCGFLCQGFIEFLFAPRPTKLSISVDCWKLQNQEIVNRRSPVDSEYPVLDNTLMTSASKVAAAEERKKQWENYLELAANSSSRSPMSWVRYVTDKPSLEAAFAVKAKIQGTRAGFVKSGSPGGLYWFEDYLKTLYDEYSGCTECCKCSIYIDSRGGEQPCLKRCSQDVAVHFNYNIKGYDWPDWEFNETLYAARTRDSQYVPKGHYYYDPLLFDELDFPSAGSEDEIDTLPTNQNKSEYEGVVVGCHIYPFPWSEHSGVCSLLSSWSMIIVLSSSSLLVFGLGTF